jgi:hypothetical protein
MSVFRDPSLVWFEVCGGGRLAKHRNGGGRHHIHRFRACSHLELTTGTWSLLGRDADGLIGIGILEAEHQEHLHPRVIFAPGALLRIDATGLDAPSRLTLSHDGLAFVEVELLPGVVRCEVVPAGMVEVVVSAEGSEPRERVVETTAGSMADVRL